MSQHSMQNQLACVLAGETNQQDGILLREPRAPSSRVPKT